jgi:hypothetical protein
MTSPRLVLSVFNKQREVVASSNLSLLLLLNCAQLNIYINIDYLGPVLYSAVQKLFSG